jgi:hypothetical protein
MDDCREIRTIGSKPVCLRELVAAIRCLLIYVDLLGRNQEVYTIFWKSNIKVLMTCKVRKKC